jgi:hypothetical protein
LSEVAAFFFRPERYTGRKDLRRRHMRLGLALVAIAIACTLPGEADAKRGGFSKGGSRSSAPSPVPAAAKPAASPRAGVGVGVMVPVGFGRSSSGSAQPGYALPLPPRPAEEADAPKFHSAAAEGPKPWCHDGEVVGRGAGFCTVSLKPDAAGAPALLALSN